MDLVRQARRFVAAVVLLSTAPSPSPAATYNVLPDGSGDFPTIQAAVDAAVAGDEIVLGSGTFVGEDNRGIVISYKALTIRSATGNPADCIIDCERRHQAFRFDWVPAGVSELRGVTVTRGGGPLVYFGGAVMVWLADVDIRDCDFIDNTAEEGGAIFLQTSVSLIENCVFAQNSSMTDPGGAVFAVASTTIRSCTFVGNSMLPLRFGAGVAGAGFSYRPSELTIESCLFAGNLEGGAVACYPYATIEMSCCDSHGNVGGDWVDCVSDQQSLRGNFSADPLFCPDVPYSLQADSPCAPPGVTGCGLIGARPVACGTVGIRAMGWGRIKGLYRSETTQDQGEGP